MRVGRLCEAIETTTTDDKMLMEEVLINTGWTSADAERIFLPRFRPAMCGSAFTGAHRHHHLDHLAHLVVLLEQVENDALNNTVMLRTATGISECLPSAVQFILCNHRELSVARFCLRVRRAGDEGRRVRATAQLAQLADFGVFRG